MASLHGILAELGIEAPFMHPEREVPHPDDWITSEHFAPVVGKTYEVAYGRLAIDERQAAVIRRIRVDGPAPQEWLDLDSMEPLPAQLQALPVKAYRRLD